MSRREERLCALMMSKSTVATCRYSQVHTMPIQFTQGSVFLISFLASATQEIAQVKESLTKKKLFLRSTQKILYQENKSISFFYN